MFAASLDTCVLVSSLSRDVLLEIAEQSLYRPLWSTEVLNELDLTVRRLATERGIARCDDQPDPNDRHVVAAALSGRADVIVSRVVCRARSSRVWRPARQHTPSPQE
jgi:predicted nucleic acid-binding protein